MPTLSSVSMDLRVDYALREIRGTGSFMLVNRTRERLLEVPLLLHRLMHVGPMRADDTGARGVSQRITTMADLATFQVNAVTVRLRRPLSPGDSVRLPLTWGGPLTGYAETGMRYVRDVVDSAFTIIREDALAFPVVGVPSLRANRAMERLPFTFDVRVTVPPGMVVATGGDLVDTTSHSGRVTWHARSRGPAPYLVIAVAPYQIRKGEGIMVYHFPADSAGATMVVGAAQKAIARLTEVYGPLDEAQALTIMEIPDGWGSQASLTGGIIQEASAFRDRSQLRGLYHELTHLWNARDLDAPSPRWNEGLASFLQDRLARELDGWGQEDDELERVGRRLLERCQPPAACARHAMRDYGRTGLTDMSYSTGKLMFAALFRTLGAQRFDFALRSHFQAHQLTGTRTTDLVQVFQDAGGDASRAVFEEWLFSTKWLDRLRAEPSVHAVLNSSRR